MSVERSVLSVKALKQVLKESIDKIYVYETYGYDRLVSVLIINFEQVKL